MSLLSIESVSKSFGEHKALLDVSLAVEAGQFVSLLGPSGCGKTTLLRMIAGFLQADSGVIRIDGEDITRLPPHQRPLNMVFQNYALFPHMSALDNIAYGPRRKGVGTGEARRLAKESLELVGLADMGSRFPRQMSGGQQQRVALARAIINRPKLLLLDEPLSALDLQLRKRMQIELKELQKKIGVAFVLVTHDQEEAMAMSDRIAVMNAGRIEQFGNGTDIYRRPESRFVADFIGDANLLQVRQDEDGSLQIAAPAPDDGSAVAVLRPEHVNLHPSETILAANVMGLDGRIETITSVGGLTNIYVRTSAYLIIARRLGPELERFREDQRVILSFQRSDLHIIRGARP